MTEQAMDHGGAPDFAGLESDLYHCSACNYCVEAVWAQRGLDHVCPTLLHHSPAYGYSGLGYLAQARAWHEGMALDLESLAERAFTCTTCGNCEEACPIGLRPARTVLALRGALNARDATPPAIARMRDNLLAEDNPGGAPRRKRGDWMVDALPTDAVGDNRLLFLAGCAGCYTVPDEARAAAAILAACGWQVESLDEAEGCCGAPLHEAGFAAEAAARRSTLEDAIRRHGTATLITLGGECLEALNDRPPAAGAAAARHPVFLLRDALAAGTIALRPREGRVLPGRIACLDPCHLTKKNHGAARDGDPAAAARALLIAAGCVVEGGAESARHALCCGAAGAMPVMNPEAATRMAVGRIEALASAGAAAIVALGPLCLGHLRTAGTAAGGPALHGFFGFLHDYFELVPGGRP